MNSIKSNIQYVEDIWLDELYAFCKKEFSKIRLHSHDHLHHMRVWQNAKELLVELEKQEISISKNYIEKIMIAVFFHDVGLTKTMDEIGHGLISSEMCKSFLKEKKISPLKRFDDLFNAIQKHDDKQYKYMVYHENLSKNNILSILCVSDDLDAFGAIGVFRYAEIYLLRDNDVNSLADRVLKNLESRYANFHALYSNSDIFTQMQKKRYEYTRDFYRNLQRELSIKGYKINTLSGAVGVLNSLIANITKGSETILSISDIMLRKSRDNYVLTFYKQFKEEVDKIHYKDKKNDN